MMRFRNIWKGIVPLAAAFCMYAAVPADVYAEDQTSSSLSDTAAASSLPVYEISMSDQNPLSTLKTEAIEKYVASSPTLSISDIDMDATTLENTAFDRTKEGLQTIDMKLTVVTNDASSYTYSETAAVKLVAENGPQIILKSEEVTIDLGSTFNYTDNIGYIQTSSNTLPASLTETDNVDVNTEGTYTVNVTASEGVNEKTTVSYTVNVVKPAEVVRAEEEAAAQAEADAQAQAEAEAAAQAEAAAEEEAAADTATTDSTTDTAAADTSTTETTTATTETASATGSAIVEYAISFVGCPYVYGGSSPSGFDCSGFTMYVYAHFGISLPHSANAQAGYGTLVSASEAQPGDLVTYNGHAAIYIGNNMIVNALNPSYGVCVCNMYTLTNGNMQIHRLVS